MNIAAILSTIWSLVLAIQKSPELIKWIEEQFGSDGRLMASTTSLDECPKLRVALEASPDVVAVLRDHHGDGAEEGAKAAIPFATLVTLFTTLLPSIMDIIAKLRPQPKS